MADFWQLIPRAVLEQEERQRQAEAWAREQRRQAASAWARTALARSIAAFEESTSTRFMPRPTPAPGPIEQLGRGVQQVAGQVGRFVGDVAERLTTPAPGEEEDVAVRSPLEVVARRLAPGLVPVERAEDVLARADPGDVAIARRLAERKARAEGRAVTDRDVAREVAVLQQSVGAVVGATEGPTRAVGRAAEEMAANIRVPKFVGEEVQHLLRETVERVPEVVARARRGVVPDEAVRELAEQAGTTVERFVKTWRPGETANAETILALREALARKTNEVVEAAAALRSEDTTENALRLRLAIEEQRALQEAVHGVTAEAGRALRQFRQQVGGALASGNVERMRRLLERAGGREHAEAIARGLATLDADNPLSVARFIRDMARPKAKDYALEFWYNSILSAPTTQVVNNVSTALMTLLEPAERALAAAVDVPLSALQRRPRERFFHEVPAWGYGALAGLPEGVRKALFVLRTGVSLDDVLRLDVPRTEAFGPATPRLVSGAAGAALGGTAGLTQGETGEERLRTVALGAAAGAALGAARLGEVGAVVNVPRRLLAAADSFWRSVNYSGALHAEAYRLARREGLRGEALAERVAELLANPSDALVERAGHIGRYRTFTQEPGEVTRKVLELRETAPALKFVIPFVVTPVNVAKAALERSPLALPRALHSIARRDPEQADHLARAMLGGAIAAAIGALYAQGKITGEAPRNPAERARFYASGRVPFAVQVGDRWISWRRLEPLNQTMAQAVAVLDAIREGEADQRSVEQMAARAALGIAKNLVSATWLSSLSAFLDAASDPERYGDAFLQRVAGSLVPASGLLRSIEQAQDPTLRRGETVGEAVAANIPGLSETVPPRLTPLGEEERREGPPFLPVEVGRTPDPVAEELNRLGVNVGLVGETVRGLPLTPEEAREYQRVAGELTRQYLGVVLQHPSYQRLPDEQKRRVVEQVVQQARQAAQRRILAGLGSETIRQRALEAATQRR